MTVQDPAPDPAAAVDPASGQPVTPAPDAAPDLEALLKAAIDAQVRPLVAQNEQLIRLLEQRSAQPPVAGDPNHGPSRSPGAQLTEDDRLLLELAESNEANPYSRALARKLVAVSVDVQAGSKTQSEQMALSRVPVEHQARAWEFYKKHPDRVTDPQAAYYAVLGIEAEERARQPAAVATTEQKRSAAQAAAAAAPALPGPSQPAASPNGVRSMTIDDYERELKSNPKLRDLADAGKIDFVG